jgi:tRNA (guanine-N7-)-methyltransferase
MLEVLGAARALFTNESPGGDWMPRPEERAPTRFEKRGARLGHGVWDLAFARNPVPG